MKIELDILRREGPDARPYRQIVPFETEDENATVATALTQINSSPDIRDKDGNAVTAVRWECSCLQKKCGACAMVIDSRPQLACNAQLREYAERGTVRVEPLRKFPVVADLIVDRSIMFENLKALRLWFNEQTKADETVGDTAYEASRCLQCGCCLEVCPNFCADGSFAGTAAMVPAARLISALPESQKNELYRAYRRSIYEGCGKSLACRNVCPAGIDIDKLLVNSNAAAVWKRSPFRRRRRR